MNLPWHLYFLLFVSYFSCHPYFSIFTILNFTTCSKILKWKFKALIWFFFSWLEYPLPTWEKSNFQRHSVRGPCVICQQISGFSMLSKKNKKTKKNPPHHSYQLREIAKWQEFGTKDCSLLYFSEIFEVSCLFVFFKSGKNVTRISFIYADSFVHQG